MEVKSRLKSYRQSPRKVRLVADLIRGLDTTIALEQLNFLNKRASVPIAKLLKSAIANAEHNFSLDPKNLFIKKITIDTGPTLKRWRARAFGKAAQIKKRSSHITITLEEKVPSKAKTAKKEIDKKEDVKTVKSLEEVKKKGLEGLEGKEKSKSKSKVSSAKKGYTPKMFQRKSG